MTAIWIVKAHMEELHVSTRIGINIFLESYNYA